MDHDKVLKKIVDNIKIFKKCVKLMIIITYKELLKLDIQEAQVKTQKSLNLLVIKDTSVQSTVLYYVFNRINFII